MKKNWFWRSKSIMLLKKLLCATGMVFAILVVYSPDIAASVIPESTAVQEKAMQQDGRAITGTVVDSDNMPIPGITVLVKGTSRGTVTDGDGKFTLSNVSPDNVLVFAFIGMKSREVLVGGQTTINVSMESEIMGLDEVVVVGYGSQKKANLTGSVSTINSEALEARPVVNVSQALQGVVPGLNLDQSGLGGELNSSMAVNIRGVGTIGQGSTSSPLVLIDGMEGNLNSLNPQDVASITVLKDASASSIYGSRAAFGVILIETKRGVAGKTTFNYNNNFRWSSPIRTPNVLDSHTFALYFNEATRNSGQNPVFGQQTLERIVQYQNGEIDYTTIADNSGKWMITNQSNANTNWWKEMYLDAAFAEEHALSVNGGNKTTQFYTSVNFLDQGGLLRYAQDKFNRYTFTVNLNTTLSEYAQLNLNTKFVREDYDKATAQNGLYYHNVSKRWPTLPVKDPNGNYTASSQISILEDGGRTKDQNDVLYLQGKLIITPVKNWKIIGEGNYRIRNYHNHSEILPAFAWDVEGEPYAIAIGSNAPGQSSVTESNRKDNFLSNNIYSNYEFDIAGSHNFNIMGGFNYDLMQFRTLAASRDNLITPRLPTIDTATDNSEARYGAYQHWATSGYFGRLNYNFKEKYLLEINGRYDGTSRFLDDKRWNFFPSISGGWNLSREEFWVLDDIIQMFKIRGSYGDLGNQNTSSLYPFYSSMPINVNSGTWLLNGAMPTTASAPGLISTLLTWERVRSWNVGADIAILQNKLIINADFFKRITYDMVGPAPVLPATLGTSVPRINNADMESAGFELETLWRDQIGRFKYSVRATLSDSKSKVTRYPNPTNNLGQWYAGREMGEIWGYTTIGIAKSQEEMDAHLAEVNQGALGRTWQAGDIMYADLNGDGEINGGSFTKTDPGDRRLIGNSQPRYRFGLGINAEYRGFDLRVFFQGIGKRDWFANGPHFWGIDNGLWQSIGYEEHMDYFRLENSVMVEAGKADVNLDSYFPRPLMNSAQNKETQTRYLQDASYVRLKNLQLGYTVPRQLSARVGIEKVRVFVSGENLLTFTNLIKTLDPETVGLSGWNDGKTYPLSSVISCGVNVNF